MPRCEERRGTTLFEVLVTMAVLGVVLVAVGELSVSGQRAHLHATGRARAFRAAAQAAARMGSELRLCRRLYAPQEPSAGWPYGQALRAGPQGALCVVFRRAVPGPPPDRVVGFRFDSGRRTLERLVYVPEFDPSRVATQVLQEPPRTLAADLEDFSFRILRPELCHGAAFVGLDLVPAGSPQPPLRVETRVGQL